MQIRWTTGMEGFDDAYSVLKAVFMMSKLFPEEIDEMDGYATHLVLFSATQPVATGRFYERMGNSILAGSVS